MALIGFATSRITSYDQARKLFWSSCPLLPLSLLVTPSLEEVCCLIGTCLSRIFKTAVRFAVFRTWALLLARSRTNGFSVEVVFGASLALVAALSILGAFALTRAQPKAAML